ncbi:g9776 [Coccomyxa elongata]
MGSSDESVCPDSDDEEQVSQTEDKEEVEQGSGDEDGDIVETQEEMQSRRENNIKALLSGSLQVQRKALLPKILDVKDAEATLRSAFKSPFPNAPARSDALRRKLLKRRTFVPWGSSTPFRLYTPVSLAEPPPLQPPVEAEDPGERLVLWEPPDGNGIPVVVDGMLTKWLRPHQREGVTFMFECVTGLRDFGGNGCILADDMGLGKTLQGIALLWTLLQSGHEVLGGDPLAKRVIICCPTSLVSNWDSECGKWLKGRVRTLPLSESSREDVISSISDFLRPNTMYQVLIVSYETFRLHAERFKGDNACDLLICDEAHRLKNDQTLINKALDSLACKRRVLLSGTPMQNHLDEFFAMVDFCNPGVLGTPSQFRRYYEGPIVAGREPDATEEVVAKGAERSSELSAIVNNFILRRTNSLLSAHLPPKVVEVVCCRPSPLQVDLYNHFLASNAAQRVLNAANTKGKASALTAINALRKLCGHPKLIYDLIHPTSGKAPAEADGFKDCGQFFPPGLFDDGRPGRSRGILPQGWHALSGKMAVLGSMLAHLRPTGERIVVVSNSTQVLDLVGQLCRDCAYPVLRLDGSTTLKKRAKMVQQFNQEPGQFVFLLSSKAGGCGINLIGGNRLVLFDPDWNPANDKQAAARVWRDGQKKRVFVYKFLTTGTIEEKVFQRQLAKEGLQQVVNNTAAAASAGSDAGDGAGIAAAAMSAEDLRDLFTLRLHTASDTFDSMCNADSDEAVDTDAEDEGSRAPALPVDIHKDQVGAPAEEDLKSWGQHTSTSTVPDSIMRTIGQELPGQVSFVFTCKASGKAIEGEKAEEVPGTSGQNAAAAATPVTPATRPAPRLGLSGAAASAPSRMCMSAAPTPASTCSRSPPGMAERRIKHTGKENAQSMAIGLGPSRLATALPAKAASCVLARKSPLGQRLHLAVPSSQRKKSPLTAKHVITSDLEQGMEQEAVKRQKAHNENSAAVTWPGADGDSSDDFE